jgi:molybdopterin/thiamine biosynthesis adenylyltransferase
LEKKTYNLYQSYNFDTKEECFFNFDLVMIFIGAGGTGGHLIPKVYRYLASDTAIQRKSIFIIDPDIVEHKNIARQNFSLQDIGKYKAEVMAEKNRDFGIKTYCVTDYANVDNIIEIADSSRRSSIVIIIDTIDNNEGRYAIHKATRYRDGVISDIWISSGNTKVDGQIVIDYRYSDPEIARNPVLIWPEMYTSEYFEAEKKRRMEESCAINAIVSPQSMAANETAALLIFNNLTKILNSGEIDKEIIFFDVEDNTLISYGVGKELFNEYATRELYEETSNGLSRRETATTTGT